MQRRPSSGVSPDAELTEVVPQLGRSQQEGELERARVYLERAAGVADVPVDVPGGVDAAVLEPHGIEVDLDPTGPRQGAPGAVAVADGRDTGARAVAVDGEAGSVEGEPIGVRAREQRDADDVSGAAPPVAGHRVAQCAAAAGAAPGAGRPSRGRGCAVGSSWGARSAGGGRGRGGRRGWRSRRRHRWRGEGSRRRAGRRWRDSSPWVPTGWAAAEVCRRG
jgi:hypothetical protein